MTFPGSANVSVSGLPDVRLLTELASYGGT